MSFKVEVTCGFYTKTEEQAEYIKKFFFDAQALMSCETSTFSGTDVVEIADSKPHGCICQWTLGRYVVFCPGCPVHPTEESLLK